MPNNNNGTISGWDFASLSGNAILYTDETPTVISTSNYAQGAIQGGIEVDGNYGYPRVDILESIDNGYLKSPFHTYNYRYTYNNNDIYDSKKITFSKEDVSVYMAVTEDRVNDYLHMVFPNIKQYRNFSVFCANRDTNFMWNLFVDANGTGCEYQYSTYDEYNSYFVDGDIFDNVLFHMNDDYVFKIVAFNYDNNYYGDEDVSEHFVNDKVGENITSTSGSMFGYGSDDDHSQMYGQVSYYGSIRVGGEDNMFPTYGDPKLFLLVDSEYIEEDTTTWLQVEIDGNEFQFQKLNSETGEWEDVEDYEQVRIEQGTVHASYNKTWTLDYDESYYGDYRCIVWYSEYDEETGEESWHSVTTNVRNFDGNMSNDGALSLLG